MCIRDRSRGTSVRILFGSLFSSKVYGFQTLADSHTCETDWPFTAVTLLRQLAVVFDNPANVKHPRTETAWVCARGETLAFLYCVHFCTTAQWLPLIRSAETKASISIDGLWLRLSDSEELPNLVFYLGDRLMETINWCQVYGGLLESKDKMSLWAHNHALILSFDATEPPY